MASALAGPASGDGPPRKVFTISEALQLLSEALHDPGVKVRAVLSQGGRALGIFVCRSNTIA